MANKHWLYYIWNRNSVCCINGGVYSAGISTGQKITSTPIRLGTWDVTVGHNADGSKANKRYWLDKSQPVQFFGTGLYPYVNYNPKAG